MGFSIGGLTIGYYGTMIAIGVCLSALLGLKLVSYFNMTRDDFILMIAYAMLGGIVGAKVLYLIINIDKINWSQIFDLAYLNGIMTGGFVFYGGVIGGLLMLLIPRYIHHIPVLEYAKVCIPCLPLAHAFGRVGCRLVGCCYGIPYDGVGAIVYHSSAFAPNNTPLFPVQLAEAIFELLLSILLLIVIIKSEKSWIGIYMYMILYGFARFILEYFRYDEVRGKFAGLYTSQWISIIMIVGGICIMIAEKRGHQRLKDE